MELNSCSKDNSEMDLELAIRSNNLILLQELLQNRANVNWQNSDGNTALHIAVIEDAGIDILQMLMENGATVAVENVDGKTPVQCLQPTSLQTFANLLKLEKYFNFRDRYNNSLMHVFMEKDMNFNKEDFWQMIDTEYEHLNIDFNSQNKSGITALRMAAHNSADHNLKYILNNVDNLDLFLMDCKGDTFLHVYMAGVKLQEDSNFFTTFLQGNTKYCPKPLVKKLLNMQNDEKDTSFHKFLENKRNVVKVCLLQLFIEAGADINMCNASGQTFLHCVIRGMTHDKLKIQNEEDQNIKYLVQCGADVNAQDCYGDSPLLLTCDIKSVCTLIGLGANVNIQDKHGLTPLIVHSMYPYKHFKVLDKLIAAGADVNIKDNHHSSVLHYAAWGVRMKSDIMVQYFLSHGCEISTDVLGHLPCQKAYERRNKEVFEMLCKCDKAVHGSSDNFNFRKKKVQHMEWNQTDLENISEFVNLFSCYRESGITKLLELPGIGSVIFEQEAEMIRIVVNDIVIKFCQEISNRDELLTSSLLPSGSVRENTKVGLPDEFDFVCILEKLSESCYIDLETTNDESGFAYLKLKPEFIGEECECVFTKNGDLDTEVVRKRFGSVMNDIFRNPEYFCHPNIRKYEVYTQANRPTCQVIIVWIGCFYKFLSICIDLAPACRVKGYWPKNARIDKLKCDTQQLREEGALLLLQTGMKESTDFSETSESKCRISALHAELKHMDSIPDFAKDAYKISKICCNYRICPGLFENNTVYCEYFFTSYILKNCMFHTLNKSFKTDFHGISTKPHKETELYKFVLKMFDTLLDFLNEEKVPSFIFPFQNILIVNSDIKRTGSENCLRCSYMKVLVKFILRLFGETVDFSDVNTDNLVEFLGGGMSDSEEEIEDEEDYYTAC